MSDCRLPDGLVGQLLDYFEVIDRDESVVSRMSMMARRGMAYLDGYCGVELDYEREGAALMLLFEFVMYARSNAIDDFSKNYRSELIALQFATKAAATVPPLDGGDFSVYGGGDDGDA